MARNGTKTGGRKKGTPNRLSKETTALLEELAAEGLACDPIEFLARVVANDREFFGRKSDFSFGVRMRAAIELAPYRASKRKAIEMTAPEGDGDIIVEVVD